jgi:hypothetical protein
LDRSAIVDVQTFLLEMLTRLIIQTSKQTKLTLL